MRLHLPGGLLRRPDADLSDITTSKIAGRPYWEPNDVLVVPFDREPTAAEAVKIRRRLVTVDAADEARLERLLGLKGSTDPFQREWVATELAGYGETA